MATTAPSADIIRINRSFIDIDSELPALCNGLRIHAVPPSGLRALWKRENRPDSMVGRLHYSLGPTLSAHFRWNVGASES